VSTPSVACSPKAVSPRESDVEETNGTDDVDWVRVVLRDLEDNFGNRLDVQLFEEFPWLSSEGASEIGRLKLLNQLEDLECLELCELSFAMSIRAGNNKG